MGTGRSCFSDDVPAYNHESDPSSTPVGETPGVRQSKRNLMTGETRHVWIRWANDPVGCEVEIPYTDDLNIYQLKRKIARRCRRAVRPELLRLSYVESGERGKDGGGESDSLGHKNISQKLNNNTLSLSSALPLRVQQHPASFVLIVTDPSDEDVSQQRARVMARDQREAAAIKSRTADMDDDAAAALDELELDGLEDGQEPEPEPAPRSDRAGARSAAPLDHDEKGSSHEYRTPSPSRQKSSSGITTSPSPVAIHVVAPTSLPASGVASDDEAPPPSLRRFTTAEEAKQAIPSELLRGGYLVSKYTWNKGTKRTRMFFLDLGDGAENNDLSNSHIYWVKKKSRNNPQKDRKSRRTIYLAEISHVTKGKTTHTFTQGDAQSAIESHCLSIHFRALVRAPSPSASPSSSPAQKSRKGGGDESGDEEEGGEGELVEVSRTLDVEVQSEPIRDEVVDLLTKLSKLARKHAKKKNLGSGGASTRTLAESESKTKSDQDKPMKQSSSKKAKGKGKRSTAGEVDGEGYEDGLQSGEEY